MNDGEKMRAAWFDKFGAAQDVLTVGEIDKPSAGPGEVLVQLHASGVNPSDVKKRAGSFPNLLDDIFHRDRRLCDPSKNGKDYLFCGFEEGCLFGSGLDRKDKKLLIGTIVKITHGNQLPVFIPEGGVDLAFS